MLTTSNLLPHRLNVWRDTGQRNELGERIMQTTPATEAGILGMVQIATDVRCRMDTPVKGLAFAERSRLVFDQTTSVFCEPNVDVHEADRIRVYEPIHNTIILPDGIILYIHPQYSMEVIHHLELEVRIIRGPLN